eukprot:1276014-Lingulodinium_polyedra.AAC.1
MASTATRSPLHGRVVRLRRRRWPNNARSSRNSHIHVSLLHFASPNNVTADTRAVCGRPAGPTQ